MRPEDILVAGGQGKLGSALGQLGANALGRSALDVLSADSATQALDTHKPNLVINCAAYTNVDKAETDVETAHALNAEGAQIIANACAEHRIPLIHISTDCVFGDGAPNRPVSETAKPNPLSVYGQSKLEGEQAVHLAKGTSCIARVSWLFDHGPQSFIGKMLAIAQERDEMQVVDDAYGRPTEIGALAAKLLKLAELMIEEKAVPPVLHLGSPDPVSRFGWAQEIFAASAKLGGPAPALSPCSSDIFSEPARRPRGLVLDTRLADGLLGSFAGWQQATHRAVAELVSKTARSP
jgi:dTDP-4-dehydrorhamnose reductase